MANEKVLLRAEALKLGIDGYRTMSTDELRDAIKRAKGTSKGKSAAAPAKGKTASVNGTKGKTAAKSAVQKGKTSAAKPSKGKSAPAKSTTQKSSPAKGKAATGTAKRPTTAGKGKATTTAKAGKASAAKGSTSRRTAKNAPARVDIDRSKIDWRAESKVGASGKRKEVMDALRKHKGNYDKVFDALQGRARAFYKDKTKHEAERMLRWLINRVAFDFVMSTEQHTPGQRAAFGTSQAAQDIRRRARREEARKASAREARAASRGKSTRKASTARGKSSKAATKTRAKGKGRK